MKPILSVAILIGTLAIVDSGDRASDIPDPNLTPGETNPSVMQDNISSTICVRGWTATIRPPASYTTRLKIEQMGKRNLPGAPRDYPRRYVLQARQDG